MIRPVDLSEGQARAISVHEQAEMHRKNPDLPRHFEVDIYFDHKLTTITVDDRFPPYKFGDEFSMERNDHVLSARAKKKLYKKTGHNHLLLEAKEHLELARRAKVD